MPKVSIIIPVYNSETYINRCIDSVLSQSFKDFEIVAVNDGSTDNSLSLLQEYAKMPNFVLVTQQNSGPAIARNTGINVSSGEYIMFIDSDDFIETDYVKNYVSAIENSSLDVVMGGYKKITGEHIDFMRCPNGGVFSKYLITGPVSKIYKKSFIEQHKILFPDTTASEDVYFNSLVIKNNAKIGYIKDTGYYYYFNPVSISNTAHKGFSENVNILDLMHSINFKEIQDIDVHRYFIIRYIIWYLLYAGKDVTPDKFIAEYKKYFSWLNINIPNYEKNRNIKLLGPKGEQKSIGFIVFVFILFHKFNFVKLFSKLYCKGK